MQDFYISRVAYRNGLPARAYAGTCAEGNIWGCLSETGNSISKWFGGTGEQIHEASTNAAQQTSAAGQKVFALGQYLPYALIGAGVLVVVLLLRK